MNSLPGKPGAKTSSSCSAQAYVKEESKGMWSRIREAAGG